MFAVLVLPSRVVVVGGGGICLSQTVLLFPLIVDVRERKLLMESDGRVQEAVAEGWSSFSFLLSGALLTQGNLLNIGKSKCW